MKAKRKPPPRLEPIRWKKRGTVVRSDIAIRRRWRSECGRFAIEHSKYASPELADVWRAIVPSQSDPTVGVVLSHHRTRPGTVKAIEGWRRRQ